MHRGAICKPMCLGKEASVCGTTSQIPLFKYMFGNQIVNEEILTKEIQNLENQPLGKHFTDEVNSIHHGKS